MAWYDDRSRTQFVGTYANEKQLQWDVDAARKRGWSVQESGEGPEFTIGGEGEAVPASATGRLTVTFVRDEGWLTQRKEEITEAIVGTASRNADAKEAKLVKAEADLEKAEQRFADSRAAAAAVTEGPREHTEKQMLSDLKDLISKRRTQLRALEDALKEMNAAVSVGANEFARSIASHLKARVVGEARLEHETKLLQEQELVARAAKEWKDAHDRRRSAEEELRRRTAEFEAKDTALNERFTARDAAFTGLDALRR
jgi:chromosome segregation ATPase